MSLIISMGIPIPGGWSKAMNYLPKPKTVLSRLDRVTTTIVFCNRSGCQITRMLSAYR